MQRPSVLSPPSAPISPFPFQRIYFSCPLVSFRSLTRSSMASSFYSSPPAHAPLYSLGAPAIHKAVVGSKEEEEEEEEEEDDYDDGEEEEEDDDDEEEDNDDDREEIEDSDFVEVGYISRVHGLKGELRVKPSTDFPELRFGKPGRRWLRTRISGNESISEVELTAGRSHPGQKSWIISLGGIDDVDKAKQIVGSTLLVRGRDRPELEEGEFYTRDLVGMRVLLKETGGLVGRVVNVVNYGASDLLQIRLHSAKEKTDVSNSSNREIGATGPLVWVPFVEAIVPNVDMDRREMQITPPKGLLELNLRNDTRSKKERRQLEWKERKKLQQRFIAAKKKLCEMGQHHLLEGFQFGEKAQKSLLTKQIVDINFKLFQHAVQSVNMPFDRFKLSEFLDANSAVLLKNSLRLSDKCLVSCAIEDKNDINYAFHKEGLELLLNSKAAIIVVVSNKDSLGIGSELCDVYVGRPESKLLQLQDLLLDCKKFMKVEEQDISVPLILVSPAHEIRLYEELLLNNDCFGFNSQKVWFFEEEKLPIVSTASASNKILFKSSWEILQAPTGSGGVFSILSSRKIVDNLNEMGVEYVQVCSLGERSAAIGNPLFFGFVKSQGADIGIEMLEGKRKDDDEFDMIFSMRQLSKMCKQIDKLDFHAVPEQHPHVDLVEGKWVEVEVHPSDKPNSYRLRSSIYSTLNTCSLDTICCILQFSE